MGQVSLSDLQRIDLIQLEIEERKNIKINKLVAWKEESFRIYNKEN